MENRIVVSDINIEVQKKNIKNIHLSVLPPDGKVRISVPVSAKEETIRLFAISKIGWIKPLSKSLVTRQSGRNLSI
jgi:predicted metal-dependent hydrolase